MTKHSMTSDPYLDAEIAYRRDRLVADWHADSWWTRLSRHLHPEEENTPRRSA